MRAEAITAPRPFGPISSLLPVAVMLLGSIAVRSDLAATWPRVATFLYVWAVADATLLPLIARAPGKRPSARAIIGALAASALTILVAGGATVRAVIGTYPILAAPLLLVVLAHVGWGTTRAARQLRRSGVGSGASWVDAAAELLPGSLVALAAAELRILRLALFSWHAEPDVPRGTHDFSYHLHLAPMAAALLSLQAIEIGVVHILVALWSPSVATVLLGLSLAGFLYLLGLIKSFRLQPVLITPAGVRVRLGLLVDRTIPFESIESLEANPAGAVVRDPATWNAALLAWPNLVLHLRQPIARRNLARRPPCTAIAFRLDVPAAFIQRFTERRGLSPACG